MTKRFQRNLKKLDVKIAFFGDNFHSDIYATHNFNEKLKKETDARWDVIAVVEEFSQIEPYFSQGKDPKLIPHDQEIWGHSYF